MNDVTVGKESLLAKLRENRGQHRKIFEEAVEGYHKTALTLLQKHIDRVRAGSIGRIAIAIPQPEDHTSDYDRAIAMLEMSVDDEIEIDEQSFASYVMDDWGWKGSFLATNSAYSATAASMLS